MLELTFESGEDTLTVRRFRVREAISTPFEVTLEATSPSDDLDFEAIVGRRATFRVAGARHGGVELSAGLLFRGVCSSVEHLRVEQGGHSSYALRLVPALWLLSQRRNYRVFQHRSDVEIVQALLAEWGVEAAFRVDPARHPRREYRVQHGESDLDFITRLIEDAGVAYVFSTREADPPVVFSDDLRGGEERAPLVYVDDPSTTERREHATEVRLTQEVRPGKWTLRDVDFRKSPRYQLLASAGDGTPEERYEQYHFAPGAFLVEGGAPEGAAPAQPQGGAEVAGALHDEREGKVLATRALERARSSRRAVSLRTNADLRPGVVFTMAGHPRKELGAGQRLLCTELVMEGLRDGEWTRSARAALVGPEQPYVAPLRAPRPRINSLQSAVVVGPANEEIHVDEFGRVRVQFPWDREGRFDERSSCWIRVSQGWAGAAYGMMALPRVGQEVLVGFLEGDPDQPIITGRVFNNTTPVPYKLPQSKTISTWKSASSPGAEGFNEIQFEDARGGERIYVQAERNLEKLVKVDETVTIGQNLTKTVRMNETETTGQNRTIAVGLNRTTAVGVADTTVVGVRHAVAIGAEGASGATGGSGARGTTGLEMVDRKITLSTGEATITLEGPNITLDAAAAILLQAASTITVNATARIVVASGASVTVEAEDGDVVIQGGPTVRINPEIRRKGGADDDDDDDDDEDDLDDDEDVEDDDDGDDDDRA